MIKVRLLSFLSLLRGRKGTPFVFYVYETEIHSVKSCTKLPRFVKVTQTKKISDDQSSSFVFLVSFTGTKRDTVFVLSV